MKINLRKIKTILVKDNACQLWHLFPSKVSKNKLIISCTILLSISGRYGVHQSQIRAYFHYQPSYYHLHVHFTHVKYNAPGTKVEHAHLLTSVIENIRKQSNHYSQALLPFSVKESSGLYQAYEKAGYDFGKNENGGCNSVDIDKTLQFFR